MERLTNSSKKFECRMKHCYAERWMYEIYGEYPSLSKAVCDRCPFIQIVNRLADYEDVEERKNED